MKASYQWLPILRTHNCPIPMPRCTGGILGQHSLQFGNVLIALIGVIPCVTEEVVGREPFRVGSFHDIPGARPWTRGAEDDHVEKAPMDRGPR
jgi:hypothetical protein